MSPANPGRTAPRLLDVLDKAGGFLRGAGCRTPRLDAQLLLAHVLGCDRLGLYVDFAKPLSSDELDAYRALIRRRARREPVAYLVGEKEFWSLPIRVDRRVLIPRPDSETLIEQAQTLLTERPPSRFADIGTGSGCLACALANVFPASYGVAVDSDDAALAVARENFEALGLSARVDARLGNLTEPLDGHAFGLICANLPYVPSNELPELEADVRLFEPLAALDGGPDGLRWLQQLIAESLSRLAPGGWLLAEVGRGQADLVVERYREAGFGEVHTRGDLAGVSRVVAGRRPQTAL